MERLPPTRRHESRVTSHESRPIFHVLTQELLSRHLRIDAAPTRTTHSKAPTPHLVETRLSVQPTWLFCCISNPPSFSDSWCYSKTRISRDLYSRIAMHLTWVHSVLNRPGGPAVVSIYTQYILSRRYKSFVLKRKRTQRQLEVHICSVASSNKGGFADHQNCFVAWDAPSILLDMGMHWNNLE